MTATVSRIQMPARGQCSKMVILGHIEGDLAWLVIENGVVV